MKYITIIIAILISGCTPSQEPKEGPNGSWWVGGLDGGNFIKITDDENPNDAIYQGFIYYDNEQQTLSYSGRFKLVGNLQFDPNNKDLYLGWDGDSLHLKEGSYLKAIDEFKKL